MATLFQHRAARQLLALGALALIIVTLIAPRVSGQEPQTVTYDVLTGEGVVVPASGHTDQGFPQRGDVFSGQGEVYAGGDVGGTRIGTFYYMTVGTTDFQNFESSANQIYAVARLEIWGQGSLDVTGTVNVVGAPSYLSISGGTGVFSTASGQCTLMSGEDHDSWSCDIE